MPYSRRGDNYQSDVKDVHLLSDCLIDAFFISRNVRWCVDGGRGGKDEGVGGCRLG